MSDKRRFELDELILRPGTYVNPQTEIVVIVDDSSALDTEVFDLEEFEGADWVLISDEVPVDEHARDVLIEGFQTGAQPLNDLDDEDEGDDDVDLEPDPEEE
jgi:hypothetical protein